MSTNALLMVKLRWPYHYGRIGGQIINLSITRPNITRAVGVVSQFVFEPTQLTMMLFYEFYAISEEPWDTLTSWWSNHPTTRRSTTSFYIFLGDSLISSRHLPDYLGEAIFGPITIYRGNKSVIYITVNCVFPKRTKHITVDCHFVR